ncbi:MAG: DUF305 domain-containing protein [Patescibacteria group bacterium]
MNKEAILYSVIGLLVGVVATSFFAGYAVNNNYRGMMQMMGVRNDSGRSSSSNSPQQMTGNIDRHFIEQMIPHHEDAITMADIALVKAEHQEIKDLATDIKRTQSAEITQMQEWYKGWFATEVPKSNTTMGMHGMGTGGMHMGMMGDETDTEELQNATNFDEAFIEEMIPHHQMAVMMANMLLASTDRPEMKKLAQDIITAQTKEINDMRSWAKAWGYTSSQ